MDKKKLTETDIISKFIMPTIEQAGWDSMTQIRQEVKLRDGKVIVRGQFLYPEIESKATHLLYFFVKNHPFTDGNKRSSAFLFVDFLYKNNRLLNTQGHPVINDTGLAAFVCQLEAPKTSLYI